MRPISEVPILPREEIARRLNRIKLKVGQSPKPGDGLTMNCVQLFTGLNHQTIVRASRGDMTPLTQLRISQCFDRWERGEISFVYVHKKGWELVFHAEPVSRLTMIPQVSLTESGAKLSFVLGGDYHGAA